MYDTSTSYFSLQIPNDPSPPSIWPQKRILRLTGRMNERLKENPCTEHYTITGHKDHTEKVKIDDSIRYTSTHTGQRLQPNNKTWNKNNQPSVIINICYVCWFKVNVTEAAMRQNIFCSKNKAFYRKNTGKKQKGREQTTARESLCVKNRESDRDKEKDTETERDTGTERNRNRDKQKDKDRYTDREKEGQIQTQREKVRCEWERHSESDIQSQTYRDRETDREKQIFRHFKTFKSLSNKSSAFTDGDSTSMNVTSTTVHCSVAAHETSINLADIQHNMWRWKRPWHSLSSSHVQAMNRPVTAAIRCSARQGLVASQSSSTT